MSTLNFRFVVRRGLAATWTSQNGVLKAGEIGLETDTKKAKMGDGSTAWNSLPYWHLPPALFALADLDDVNAGAPLDNQVLAWNDTAQEWQAETIHEIPAGGTTGQVLTKKSNSDYDVGWVTP